MKLKCTAHQRRVISDGTQFLHRTGVPGKCESKTAESFNPQSKTTKKVEAADTYFVGQNS